MQFFICFFILKELMDLDEINGVELFQVNHEDLKEIGVSITSQDGFFRNKTIKFIIKFKDTYPITPPKISCLTKVKIKKCAHKNIIIISYYCFGFIFFFFSQIFHPNIDENGNVCLNVLKLDWNPIINLQMLILGLVLLLNVLSHKICI